MTLERVIIETLSALFGTLGFGFLFNIRGKKLILAAIGGMLSWDLFLALGVLFESEPLRYFLVAICSTAYAEILARIMKTPAATFCIITLIPLVPGGAMYYTTTYALSGNITDFSQKAIYTLELAVALSLGIVIVTAAAKYIFGFKRKKHLEDNND